MRDYKVTICYNKVLLFDVLESVWLEDFAKEPHEAETWLQDEEVYTAEQVKSFWVKC